MSICMYVRLYRALTKRKENLLEPKHLHEYMCELAHLGSFSNIIGCINTHTVKSFDFVGMQCRSLTTLDMLMDT